MARIAVFLIAVLALAGAAASAHGATFTVTTTADGGAGSLRPAVSSANATPATLDRIAVPPGTYTIGGAAGDDDNVSGDLDIRGPIEIVGVDARTTILKG